MSATHELDLFSQIIGLCGLSPLLAPGTIRRALRDVGADPDTAAPADYLRCLPKLKMRMKVYLSEAEANDCAQKIIALLDSPPK